jgi:hypothetical protein
VPHWPHVGHIGLAPLAAFLKQQRKSLSVANWSEFWPQNTKVAGKSAADFFGRFLQKMVEKCPKFFEVCYSHKNLLY